MLAALESLWLDLASRFAHALPIIPYVQAAILANTMCFIVNSAAIIYYSFNACCWSYFLLLILRTCSFLVFMLLMRYIHTYSVCTYVYEVLYTALASFMHVYVFPGAIYCLWSKSISMCYCYVCAKFEGLVAFGCRVFLPESEEDECGIFNAK